MSLFPFVSEVFLLELVLGSNWFYGVSQPTKFVLCMEKCRAIIHFTAIAPKHKLYCHDDRGGKRNLIEPSQPTQDMEQVFFFSYTLSLASRSFCDGNFLASRAVKFSRKHAVTCASLHLLGEKGVDSELYVKMGKKEGKQDFS